MKACSIDDCGGKYVAHGLCQRHYDCWKRHGDPLYVRAVRTCSTAGCDGEARARGWCQKHYNRWQRHGDPQHVDYIAGDDEARFDSYVDKNGPTPSHPGTPATNCWLWTGALNTYGYGILRINGKMMRAHRYAYERFVGPIPDDKPHVLHHCDNPKCVRIGHLYAGDDADNSRDRVERNRLPKGEANWNAKLTWLQALGIRSAVGKQKDIAKQYGINQTTVSYIKARKAWKHLLEEGDYNAPENDPYPEVEPDLEFDSPITEATQ